MTSTNKCLWIVYGPAGCGKTDLCRSLAQFTGGVYIEGDDFHSADAIDKMQAGTQLLDADRWDWLSRLRDHSIETLDGVSPGGDVFLSCSALRSSYRDILRTASRHLDGAYIHFIYLRLPYEIAQQRVAGRLNHYMAANMVLGQYETLEQPKDYEIDIDIADAYQSKQDLRDWAIDLVRRRRGPHGAIIETPF